MTATPSVVLVAPATGPSLVTVPPVVEVASTESRVLGFDLAAQLAPGNGPSSPLVTLVDLDSGLAYSTGLVGSASVLGTVVVQALGSLVPGHTYRVEVSAAQGSGDGAACQATITCPW